MKKFTCLLLFIAFASFSTVKAQSTKYNLTTIDGVITDLYESISGEKGAERDWKTFRMLFADGAQLIPTGKNKQGEMTHNFITPEQYIETSGPWLVENGFFEEEIHREVDLFGHMAQVFSTYTSRNIKGGELIARGINSIQLFNDGERWWIMTIYWGNESPENPIPDQYDEH